MIVEDKVFKMRDRDTYLRIEWQSDEGVGARICKCSFGFGPLQIVVFDCVMRVLLPSAHDANTRRREMEKQYASVASARYYSIKLTHKKALYAVKKTLINCRSK